MTGNYSPGAFAAVLLQAGYVPPSQPPLAVALDSLPIGVEGTGYLAGSFPGGITTVDGVPTPATVRVLYRPEAGQPGDGALVAEVQSAPDGSWRVDGLDPALKFDVVGRKAWFNDVIMSNVSPKVD